MSDTIIFKKSMPSIGYLARKRVKGPEHMLIKEFAERILSKNNSDVAVFWEPLMDTGYPDLIFVYYNPKVFEYWAKNRKLLTVTDIKVLHYLYHCNGAACDTIELALGMSGHKLLSSLERLLDSKMIRRYSKQWTPHSIKKRYAVKKIVAYEAKMKDWPSAFRQAEMNKWFASESFIVSPVKKPTQKIVNISTKTGVGIYSHNNGYPECISKAQRFNLPSCYASWLFNEWIGRKLCSNSSGKCYANKR
jgi:hypothetical protein